MLKDFIFRYVMSATGMRLPEQDAHVLLARGGPHIPKLTLKNRVKSHRKQASDVLHVNA